MHPPGTVLPVCIPQLAERDPHLRDPACIIPGSGPVPYGIPVKIPLVITLMLEIHLLSGCTQVEFKCGPLVKIAVDGDPGHIPAHFVPPSENIPDQLRFAVPAYNGHKQG